MNNFERITRRALLNLIEGNDGKLTRSFFTAEGFGVLDAMVEEGKLSVDSEGRYSVVRKGSTGKTSTNTRKAKNVTMTTPVSIRVGSDQYAAKVVNVTNETVTIEYGAMKRRQTFRPYQSGNYPDGTPISGWTAGDKRTGRVYLVIGVSETVYDPSF